MTNISDMKFKISWPVLLVFIFGFFLLTFKLLEVPPGIETDEGSIAYNAALISKNLHDQNGRFLPFFILSSDNIDWKQPVLIYLSAIYFKLFGPSLFVFKMVNVSVAFLGIILIWYLLNLIFKNKYLVLIGTLIAFTSPMVIITARLGNESVQPILWTTLWLLSLKLFTNTKKNLFLSLAALALGIGFYSFKGMRILVPIWTLLTFVYLYFYSHKQIKTFISQSFIFGLTLLPFFLVTPLLELKYAGAVFDRQSIHLESYRFYIYYWLQNLSLAFLFVQPDIGKIYATDLYGPFLLSLLPFFLLGVKQSLKKFDFNLFTLICFIATPLLFGLAQSLNYSHRLVALVPFFAIITTFGFQSFFTFAQKKSHFWLIIPFLFVFINFMNFVNFYYFEYPKFSSTRQAFDNNFNSAFYQLSLESTKNHLTPYVQVEIYNNHGDGSRFFEQAYFKQSLKTWKLGDPLPPKSILLTEVGQIDGLTRLKTDVGKLNLLISQ